jgi:hypothetical protein
MVSTNSAPRQRIYQGKGDMASALRRMLTDGRRVISQERTRLIVNRQMYLGNQYLQIGPTGVRTRAPAVLLKTGRRRDVINRLRQFVDGRVAMLTREVPPYEVVPRSLDLDDMSSARLAERIVRYEWTNRSGWDVDTFRRDLVLAAEQDGIAFACVVFDQRGGPLTDAPVPLAIDPTTGQVSPITDRETLESLKTQDPEGGTLWREERVPVGQVKFRVVRLGRLAVDPLVTADWRSCRWIVESDVWSIEEAERIAGRSLEDIRRRSDAAMGSSRSGRSTPGLNVEDGISERYVPPDNAVVVHEAYVVPQGKGSDWPRGGHVVWLDAAPGDPILSEPWEEELPYFPFAPKPDHLELLRSRGTVDDLVPIQVVFNRTISAIGEWMDLMARPPLVLDGGRLRNPNKPVFNEERIVETNPGMSPPRFMDVPTAQVAALMQYADFLLRQMAEIAVQADVTRGTPPGQGVEAGVALDVLGRNNEIQLTGTEARLKAALEWAISRALSIVARNYVVPRLVNAPGVDDDDALQAFTGDKIRGSTTFRITGSILPRNREAQLQTLLAMVRESGGKVDISRYATEFMRGDVEAIEERQGAQRRRQARENRKMAALGRHPLRDLIWQTFVAQREAYLAAVEKAAQGGMPITSLQQAGLYPPTITGIVRNVRRERSPDEAAQMRVPGLPGSYPENWPDLPAMPQIEDFDDHAVHYAEVANFCMSDGYDQFHPIVKQVLREHRDAHREEIARAAQAAQAQVVQLRQPNAAAGQPRMGSNAQDQADKPQEEAE